MGQQLKRFLIVGGGAACIDFATYRTGLHFHFDVNVSKTMGFLVGTTVAYFANKFWTFGSSKRGVQHLLSFIALYLLGLLVNVVVNNTSLGVLELLTGNRSELIIALAFAVATACSASWNFLGLKFFVFAAPNPEPTV